LGKLGINLIGGSKDVYSQLECGKIMAGKERFVDRPTNEFAIKESCCSLLRFESELQI